MVLRIDSPNCRVKSAMKRKKESKPLVETENMKTIPESPQPKKIKNKPVKSAPPILDKVSTLDPQLDRIVNITDGKKELSDTSDVSIRYPILEDKELIQKFLSVSMTNNQKGRIRQLLKDSLKGTSEFLLPDVIHNRIQSILKSTDMLSETELRKIRILYNMLKTALTTEKSSAKKKIKKTNSKKTEIEKKDDSVIKKDDKIHKEPKTEHGDVKAQSPVKDIDGKKVKSNTDKPKVVKSKGPKRYVVFLGNLPLDINKEQIMQHFSEFNECIVDVRIPKHAEGKKSSIAYVELKNEPTYELALSKHHSMLGNKRINVLYTTQKNGKVSRTEAKSKSAKLIALQKAGKLIGSIPVNRKRSHRRMKMKRAQAKLAAESH